MRKTQFSNTDGFTALPNLRWLDLSENTALAPTATTFANIGHLATLIMSHNNLSVITAAILNPLVSLTRLDLNNNTLVSIGNGVFNNNQQLHTLNLGQNQIDAIQYNTFDELRGAEVRVNLLGNVCTNQEFVISDRNFDNIRNGLQVCFDNYNHTAGHNIPKFAIIFMVMIYVKRFF